MFLEATLSIIIAASFVAGTGENDREFRDMCMLYTLLIQPVPEPKPGKGPGDTVEDLSTKAQAALSQALKINLTIIEAPMLKALLDKQKYENEAKLVATDSPVKGYFENLTPNVRQEMMAAARATDDGSQDQKDFARKYGLPLSESKKQMLRPAVSALTAQTIKTLKEVSEAVERISKARAETRRAMLQALFGKTYEAAATEAQLNTEATWDKTPAAADFPWSGQVRDTACAATNGNDKKAGYALATDIICICSLQHDSAANVFCTGNSAPNQQESGAKTPSDMAERWTKLSAICKNNVGDSEQQLSGPALSTAVTRILAHLGKNMKVNTGLTPASALTGASHDFLGFFSVNNAAPQCDSNDANPQSTATKGVCINYAKLLKSKTGIPWAAKVSDAVTKLETISKEYTDATALLAQAASLTAQIEAAVHLGKLLAAAGAPNKATTELAQKTCPEKNKTAEEWPTSAATMITQQSNANLKQE
uniref:Variant surface glycoprotein 1125.1474 n=1 Tax=Trypanosoma brucei TaxID=5691 RepID=A0A1J0R736_9TRYP|nr:variant surface glycoprotein 1125.1474 [Trypanosoma brucei]